MADTRPTDKLVLGACVAISVWMMTWDEPTQLRVAREWAHRITLPLQYGARVVENAVALGRENAELRTRLTALSLDLAQVEAERDRIEELEARAGFHERSRGRLLPATVVEIDVARIPSSAKIAFSAGAELRPLAAVVSERGLVGRISQRVGDDAALVQLLTHEDSRISVEIVRTGVTGLLRYDGRRFHLDNVPRGEPVAVGDRVVSSGLGRTVPRGLPIGEVTAVVDTEDQHFQEVLVRSNVHFTALRRVYVVTREGPWYARGADFSSAPFDSGDGGGP